MLNTVVKRNGNEVDFNVSKIKTAITKAFDSTKTEYNDSILDLLVLRVTSDFQNDIKDGKISVEDVQDSVEKVLSSAGYEDVSKAYILYRKQHENYRNAMSHCLNYKDTINKYINVEDWRVKENSTVTYSVGGLILSNSGAVTANYWLSEIYDKEIADAHKNCDLHIHDLSMLTGYCFTGDTKIKLIDGTSKSFKELVDEGIQEFSVESIDVGKGCSVTGHARNPRITRNNAKLVKVILNNGQEIKCTPDHQFMMYDLSYKEASKLKPGETLKCVDQYYLIKVQSVEKLDYTEDVYDITVDDFHNFLLDCGVYVHNCAGWNLKQLIKQGLGIPGKTTSTPASHLSTLCNQMVNFLGCFTDDTRIILADGSKPTIREMLDSGKTEWLVKSYDPKTDKVIDSKMNNLHNTRTVDEYYELEFDDRDKVKCTIDHKFYTLNRGWVEARDLTEDDNCVGINLNNVHVSNRKLIHETKDVYCGTVDNEFHGFFVNDGKLISNCLQNEWAGAQAFSSFDTYLAPFVKVDNLSYKEVKQCIQSFIFGVNTPSRWGTQAPFSNITLDWTVPEDIANLPAIVGGKEMDFTYGDCKKEMDMINKAFIEVMIEGDANGRGFQYPIPTYSITKDFDWSETENNKMLFEMTAKYGTPYFSNYINSDMSPSDVRSMCCRLRLDLRELRRKNGGFFGSGESTGSVGVVTINMPRIAYLSKDEKEFYEKLDHMMDIAARSLDIKRKVINKLLDDGLYPYTKFYLGTFDNHFSTIGLVGMNEAGLNAKWLRCDMTDKRCQKFAGEVLDHMRNRLSDYQEMYPGAMFNLEATPAESTSFRLAKHDKEIYPDIITASDSAQVPYYTNSSHLPVGYTDDVFSALDVQDDLQTKYTSGTVFHAFLGEKLPSWKAAMNLVKKIAENYRLPYYTISPTYSVCKTHGYLSGEHFKCPTCGENAEVYSRITGYYRPVQNWNDGKTQEYKQRKEYIIETSRLTHNGPLETRNEECECCNHEDNNDTKYDAVLITTSTCPNCKIAKKYLEKVGFEYHSVVADINPDEAKKYDVKQAPTLLILENGEYKKYQGAGAIKGFTDSLKNS